MTRHLITIGFISILGQVVILRELSVAFYGIELIYILSMGIWLFWTAIGAIIGRRAYLPSTVIVRSLFIIFALLLPFEVAFVRGVRFLFGGIQGAYLPFGQQLSALAIILLPMGILLGLVFRWAAKLYMGTCRNRTLALAYALESAGGLFGGLTSTLLLQFGIQNFSIAILCSMSAVGIFLLPFKKKQNKFPLLESLVFLILAALLWFSPDIDRRMMLKTYPNLVESRDSPYSRITITEQSDQFVIFENDILGFETESIYAEELVHLPAMHLNSMNKVLILGGGIEGVLKEILKYSPLKIDYVELNPLLLNLVHKHLPKSFQTPLTSKTVKVHNDDPRRFLKDSDAFDLILVGMPGPSSGQSNRFYTVEFFKQCAERLKPGGVLAFRFKSSENIWTQYVVYRNTSIYLSLKSVFHDVLVLPGGTNTIIASHTSLNRNPLKLIDKFTNRKINTRLITPAYINYLYTNDRFQQIANRLDSTKAPLNTDIQPICYRYSSMIWLSKFIPEIINWDIPSLNKSKHKVIIVYLLIISAISGLFLLGRRSVSIKGLLLSL